MTTTSLPTAEARGRSGVVEDEPERVISHAHARTIASYWLDQHDPKAPLTVLARTGAITEDVADSVEGDLRRLELATADEVDVPVMAQTQLVALLDYVQHHGPRAPLPEWSELPDDDPWSRGLIPLPQAAAPASARAGEHDARHEGPAAIYERLGGGLGIGEVVETFYRTVLADPTLAPYFDGIDIHRVKAHQYSFITAAAGGPDYYAGRSLRRAHSGLGITQESFDRIIDHLVASLEARGIEQQEIGQVVGKIVRFRDEIIGADQH